MKIVKYAVLALMIIMTTGIEAKTVKVPQVYIFGFSASFTDPIVYFTDIQAIPNVWIDKKSNFLAGRDNYSYQLKSYLTEQQQPNRVCMVFYSTSKKKAEKQYLKLRKKYLADQNKKKKKKVSSTSPELYDVRYITAQEFQFQAVDPTEQ